MKIIIKNFKVPSLNKSYAGRHWSKRKEEADFIHQLVMAEVSGLDPITTFPIDVYITGYYKHKIRRDSGNVSNKELIDGLVYASLIPDDSTKYIRWTATRAIIGADEDKVEIEIR